MQSHIIILKIKKTQTNKQKKSQGKTEAILKQTSSGTVYIKYLGTSLPISDPALIVALSKF